MRTKTLFSVAAVLWFSMVSGGLWLTWNYQNTPGVAASAPVKWVMESRIQRTRELPTLVLAIHPHCPCSRATIGELALLMAHVQGLVNANVVFVKPHEFSEDWEKTDLWKSASGIPGVTVMTDEDGVEAAHFGSRTSGQVVLYDADGQLIFSGGITSSRGHSGENEGRSAIASWLISRNDPTSQTQVFGCSLFKTTTEKAAEEFCNGLHGN
jgi:hypothetical protein